VINRLIKLIRQLLLRNFTEIYLLILSKLCKIAQKITRLIQLIKLIALIKLIDY